jgi:hypothetical protein
MSRLTVPKTRTLEKRKGAAPKFLQRILSHLPTMDCRPHLEKMAFSAAGAAPFTIFVKGAGFLARLRRIRW